WLDGFRHPESGRGSRAVHAHDFQIVAESVPRPAQRPFAMETFMKPHPLTVPMIIALSLSACSIKRTAVDVVGDAISGGSGVYSSDPDPDLVKEAIPFGLKTYESLLAVDPNHQGMLLAAANGFVGYGYILGQDADRLEATDLAGARALRARASKLFLRGR